MKQWLKNSGSLFFVLFIVFVPLQFSEINFQLEITKFLFLKPVLFFKNILNFSTKEGTPFTSDSSSLFFLLIVLLLLASLFGVLLKIFKIAFLKGCQICKIIVVYFLIFVFLKYGFDKVFMLQFCAPESNILYSPFGIMTKDILYWSVIGTSKFYNIALGLIEIFVAILLVFNKTRVLGLLVALGVFLNIFLVNIGFDISVKILSGILILATLFLLLPTLKPLCRFFILGKQTRLIQKPLQLFKNKIVYIAVKTFVIGLFFIQILYAVSITKISPKSGMLQNFKKVYKVEQMILGNDTLKESETPIKRIFFHRDSYLIFQDEHDEMRDYYIKKISSEKLYILDYQLYEQVLSYRKSETDEFLILEFESKPFWTIHTKEIDWQALPLLKEKPHFFVDEVK